MHGVQELPIHLIAIGAKERLEAVLVDWQMFDMLYDDVFSSKLIGYWRQVMLHHIFFYLVLNLYSAVMKLLVIKLICDSAIQLIQSFKHKFTAVL